MKLVEHNVKKWGIVPLVGTKDHSYLKWIEQAGRTCYKSDHMISDKSYERFVYNIWKSGHGSVLEHSNFILRTEYPAINPSRVKRDILTFIGDNDYINVEISSGHVYIGGNFRAWLEIFDINHKNYAQGDFDSVVKDMVAEWTKMLGNITNSDFININPFSGNVIPRKLQMVTYEFKQDRAFMAELTRHRRDIAFSVESQRYCSYNKEVEFVLPYWYNENGNVCDAFFNSLCFEAEKTYQEMIKMGLRPQAARGVLPNATSTTIICTATMPEWNHILKLRTAPGAHPDMIRAMNIVRDTI